MALIGTLIGIYILKKSSPKKSKPKPTKTITTEKKQEIPPSSPSEPIYDKDYKFETSEQITDLFKKLNLIYNKSSKFDQKCKMFENASKFDFLPYKEHQKKYDELSAEFEERIVNRYVAPMYIKWVSKEIGYGCFAAADIQSNKMIGEFAGEIIPTQDIAQKTWSWNYPIKGRFDERLPKNISVDCSRFGNETRFVNHSEEPNAKAEFIFADGAWRIVYVSLRQIHKDEEIRVKYHNRELKIN